MGVLSSGWEFERCRGGFEWLVEWSTAIGVAEKVSIDGEVKGEGKSVWRERREEKNLDFIANSKNFKIFRFLAFLSRICLKTKDSIQDLTFTSKFNSGLQL